MKQIWVSRKTYEGLSHAAVGEFSENGVPSGKGFLIQIKDSTVRRLNLIRKPGQAYDDVISGLIRDYENL